ncbi:hypothetical protein [Streptomyces sp. NPDC012888]|uniref:hypothetical protein n=1 Tax=Streptomyces sp. NPDC012888 TaxID=3364855 RepID=UPI003674D6D8
MKVTVEYAVGVVLLTSSKAVELIGDRWDTAASWTQAGVIAAATGHVVINGVDELISITRRVRRLMLMADALDEDSKTNGADAGVA